MRRPVISISLAFGSGIAADYILEADIWLWLILLTASVSVSLFFVIRPKKRIQGICMVLCIFSAGGIWMQIHQMQQDPLMEYQGRHVTVSGIVRDVSEREHGYNMVVKSGHSLLSVGYYGTLEDCSGLEGEKVTLEGVLSLPQQRRNPGCFDYRLYLRSCGIQLVMTADNVTKQPGQEIPFLKAAAGFRNTFEKKLQGCVEPEFQGIILAMLFGEKTRLDENLYETFQKNGTAHILAVSGLHIGILYGFFSFCWRGYKGCLFYFSAAAVLFFYTALADFSPSVLRAAIMIGIHLMAKILHRRYDLLSAAGFTFSLMLLNNPFQLFHTGFQLSFLAVASLGVILPFAERVYQGIFLSSIVMQAGMLPYSAYVFNYISLGAFFANVPVIFLAGLLLPAGMSLMAAAYLSDVVFSGIAAFLCQGCRLLIWINDCFYAGGNTSYDVISPPVWLLVLYYGLLFFLLSEKGRILFMRKKTGKILTMICFMVCIAISVCQIRDSGFSHSQITFVDVGQGDCIHIRTPEGKNYLVDGGGSTGYQTGKKILKPYLLKNGVRRIDAAFVTHLHEDHYGGIRDLAKEGMIKSIGIYEGNRLMEKKLKQETGAVFFYLHKGQHISLGENVTLDILAPERKNRSAYESLLENGEDENSMSLILKLSYNGISLLITGDIDTEGESQLLQKNRGQLKCDILKVAHHGSRYSTSDAFLEAVSPDIAVFQVGKNNFGHPSQSVIEKCRQKGIMILRNDTSGAIGLYTQKESSGIVIEKMLE